MLNLSFGNPPPPAIEQDTTLEWFVAIASLMGALAWPLVIIVALVAFRTPLSALISRAKEAEIAGQKITFEKQLAVTEALADVVVKFEDASVDAAVTDDASAPKTEVTPHEKTEEPRSNQVETEKLFPRNTALRTFRRAVDTAIASYSSPEMKIHNIYEAVDRVALFYVREPLEQWMRRDWILDHVSPLEVSLFQSFRKTRDQAVHGTVDPDAVREYADQASKLLSRLIPLLAEFRHESRESPGHDGPGTSRF